MATLKFHLNFGRQFPQCDQTFFSEPARASQKPAKFASHRFLVLNSQKIPGPGQFILCRVLCKKNVTNVFHSYDFVINSRASDKINRLKNIKFAFDRRITRLWDVFLSRDMMILVSKCFYESVGNFWKVRDLNRWNLSIPNLFLAAI